MPSRPLKGSSMQADHILDLGNADPKIIEIDRLARQYGIQNMEDVFVQIVALAPQAGKSLAIVVDESTAADIIASFICLAVLNYAVSRFQKIEIQVGNTKPISFYRNVPVETSEAYADEYVEKAKELILKFFPENPA